LGGGGGVCGLDGGGKSVAAVAVAVAVATQSHFASVAVAAEWNIMCQYLPFYKLLAVEMIVSSKVEANN